MHATHKHEASVHCTIVLFLRSFSIEETLSAMRADIYCTIKICRGESANVWRIKFKSRKQYDYNW